MEVLLNQYITSIGLFYKKWEVCGGLSDCEELSGGYLQEEVRLVLVDIDINL